MVKEICKFFKQRICDCAFELESYRFLGIVESNKLINIPLRPLWATTSKCVYCGKLKHEKHQYLDFKTRHGKDKQN